MDIKKSDRTVLKSYFVKNAMPTSGNFADLIEGVINQKEDGLAKLPGEPLSVQADGDATSQKKAINFYASFADPQPAWTLSLNPRIDPANPGTSRAGLSFGDAAGASKLFIAQSPAGNVGIGTVTPQAKLDVNGALSVNGVLKTTYMFNTARDPDSRLQYGGSVVIKGSAPQIDFLDTDHNEWAIHVNSNKMYFVREPWNYQDLVLDGAGNVGMGTDGPRAKLEVRGGAIMPSAGNSAAAGIQFPPDPGGGGGDTAWLRFYARQGESCTLELGIANDGDDHIALMASGNVGIGTTTPAKKLDVNGDIQMGAGRTFYSPGRMHIHGEELLYLLHKSGVIVGKEWGGTGDLTVQGTAKVSVLQLGDKWRLSAVGDSHANDDWLRLFNPQNTGYYGGLAAGRLWASSGSLSGSDLRLKTQVSPLREAAENVLKLRGVRFRWRDAGEGDAEAIGLIAQEVEQVFPEVVQTGPDGMKGVNYSALVAPLIEALKAQQAQIGELQAQVRALAAS